MARLASIATGNWTVAATWGLIDATSFLDVPSGTNSTALTAAFQRSAAFTPGAITIDGIAIYLGQIGLASPVGTITVSLYNDTGAADVAGTEVTLTLSDLPVPCLVTRKDGGWVLFKLAAPVLLLTATAYKVQAKVSAGATATNLMVNTAAANWSRFLRTTATQAPVAADILYVLGEHTGQGTGNDLTVTMDETLTTDYGPGTDGSPAVWVCQRGTLTWGTAASTNYYLKLSGNLVVTNNGALNIGTVAVPIPRTSTVILEFDPVADGGMGVDARGGTTVIQGLSRTAAKNVWQTTLTANAALGATSLTVADDTGWLNGDEIIVLTTTRTKADTEKVSLTADAGAASLTVGALAAAHSGTSPTQATVALLTRNVLLRSANSALSFFCAFQNAATCDLDWAAFQYIAGSTGTFKQLSLGATGAMSVEYCVVRDTRRDGIMLYNASNNYGAATVRYCVVYNFATLGNQYGALAIYGTSGTPPVVTDCVLAGSGSSIATAYGLNLAGTQTGGAAAFDRIEVVGTDSGVLLTALAAMTGNLTFDAVNLHCNNFNVQVSGALATARIVRFTNGKIWRGFQVNAGGVYLPGGVAGGTILEFDTCQIFGNLGSGYYVAPAVAGTGGLVRFLACTCAGDTSFATARGVFVPVLSLIRTEFESCTFGVASGIFVAHTTADLDVVNATSFSQLRFRNCTFASTTEINGQTNLPPVTGYRQDAEGIVSQKHDQTANTHRSWWRYGTVSSDTTIFRTTSPAERLTPNNASGKLQSAPQRVAVASGATATVRVYVRESVVGDGTDYNGARPRLIVRRHDFVGITADTVLATATVASEGAWEQLSGTTAAVSEDCILEVFVDADGTTGWITVDDWAFSHGKLAKFYDDGQATTLAARGLSRGRAIGVGA